MPQTEQLSPELVKVLGSNQETHTVKGVQVENRTQLDFNKIFSELEQGKQSVDAASQIENLDKSTYDQVMDMVNGRVTAAVEAVKPLLKTVKEKMKFFTEQKVALPAVAESINETRIEELVAIVQAAMERSKNMPKFEVRALSTDEMARIRLNLNSQAQEMHTYKAVDIKDIPALQGLEHNPVTGRLEEVHTYKAVNFENVFGMSKKQFMKETANWEAANTGRK